MEWNNEDLDNVTGRIEKINMQFSKLLEEMNATSNTPLTTNSFKVSLGEVTPQPVESNAEIDSTNYYANMIEKSRQVKAVPKHAIALSLDEHDRKILDEQLGKIYATKKAEAPVYDMKEICDTNKNNTVVIDYSTVPTERALVVKKTWKDILFSDIDFNKQIDVWGAVKRFCTKQINIKF